MQIDIVNVENQKVKTYFTLSVSYKDFRGDLKSWKLFSFSNPASYGVLKDAKPGERYEITTGKDAKDYTVWTSATKLDGAAPTPAASSPSKASAWVPDADRQRLIVKQSCLKAAVDVLIASDAGLETDRITALSDEFVAYIYDVPALEVETE